MNKISLIFTISCVLNLANDKLLAAAKSEEWSRITKQRIETPKNAEEKNSETETKNEEDAIRMIPFEDLLRDLDSNDASRISKAIEYIKSHKDHYKKPEILNPHLGGCWGFLHMFSDYHKAKKKDLIDVWKFLIDKDNVNKIKESRRTFIEDAVTRSTPEGVQLLLDRGADVPKNILDSLFEREGWFNYLKIFGPEDFIREIASILFKARIDTNVSVTDLFNNNTQGRFIDLLFPVNGSPTKYPIILSAYEAYQRSKTRQIIDKMIEIPELAIFPLGIFTVGAQGTVPLMYEYLYLTDGY